MQKGRLEAFSDGVLAIIITIMVLQLKVPHGATFAALRPGLPVFLGYVLSFVYVGIYWNNHHHLLGATSKIDGRVLWPNLHLLFWLSLVPYTTDWVGETSFAPAPLAAYGFVLLLSALAFKLLQSRLAVASGPQSVLARAVARDWKNWLSMLGYVLGIAASFWQAWAAGVLYVLVALGWLIPDRRIERGLVEELPSATGADGH